MQTMIKVDCYILITTGKDATLENNEIRSVDDCFLSTGTSALPLEFFKKRGIGVLQELMDNHYDDLLSLVKKENEVEKL